MSQPNGSAETDTHGRTSASLERTMHTYRKAWEDTKEAFDNLSVLQQADRAELLTLRAENARLREQYHDLIYQVGKVTPNETRHESARRIIRTHEDVCGRGGPVSPRPTPGASGE